MSVPTMRDKGARCYIDTPQDGPYGEALADLGAHWDATESAWWVGRSKANYVAEQMLAWLVQADDDTSEDEDEDADDEEDRPKASAAKLLTEIALRHYDLGVTDMGDTFGVSKAVPHLALMLRGGKQGLRAELASRYWDAHNTPAPQQALADALAVLEGLAGREEPAPLALRVAERDGVVYVDMGDVDGTVIEIGDGCWDTGVRAPVLFRRTKLTAAMPKPHMGGDVGKLWDFVPIDAADRPQLLAWLVQALIHPATPHPVVCLNAEQGSGKTSAAKCLVALTDPASVPVRKAPKDAEGWVTAANASWVVALDNLSGEIPQWLSDSLCRAVTGDGDVRRALYTDLDVSVVSFRRAVILTGIDITVTQGDLADRLLRIRLPRIETRRSDEELAQAWAEEYQNILGGLLTLAADVHHRLKAQPFDGELPRMADYARVLAAVDGVLGTSGLDAYRNASQQAAADTLDHPFIDAVRKEAESREFIDTTSAEILAYVTPAADSGWRRPQQWPKSARAVTGMLTRHAPALRALGWEVDNDEGRNEAGTVQWTIRPPAQPEKAGNDNPFNPCDPPQGDNSRSGQFQGSAGDGLDGLEAPADGLGDNP